MRAYYIVGLQAPSSAAGALVHCCLSINCQQCCHASGNQRPYARTSDLGHNDVGWANKRTLTPHLDALCKGGIELSQWYVFK